MEKTPLKPKKILFLITKSNWGEKWEGTHFARLYQLFFEARKEIVIKWTASVRRRQATPLSNLYFYDCSN